MRSLLDRPGGVPQGQRARVSPDNIQITPIHHRHWCRFLDDGSDRKPRSHRDLDPASNLIPRTRVTVVTWIGILRVTVKGLASSPVERKINEISSTFCQSLLAISHSAERSENFRDWSWVVL